VSANVDVIKGPYDAVGKGDVPTVLAGLDPNVEWTEAEGIPYAGTYVGPDAVLTNVLVRLATEWDGFTITPQDYIDDGERIAVPDRYAGTYKETGKSYECDFAHIWTLRDGKVVRFHQNVDSAIAQEALKADS
jgi:ketosteroid isomerase-like protein